MGKTLYLEKRGCDFFHDDPIKEISDVGNYRVGVYDYSIHGKDDKDYIIEFTHYDRKKVRKYRTNGALLKHPKTEIIQRNALHIDTQYETEKGCFRNIELEEKLNKLNYSYILEDILKCVNKISMEEYTEVKVTT